MKFLSKYSTISALLVLLTFSMASQADVVDSGFKLGSWADYGAITLDPGSYTLDLTAFTFGTAGPTVFGIANLSEAFQVAVASFGAASTASMHRGWHLYRWRWLCGCWYRVHRFGECRACAPAVVAHHDWFRAGRHGQHRPPRRKPSRSCVTSHADVTVRCRSSLGMGGIDYLSAATPLRKAARPPGSAHTILALAYAQ